VSVGRNLGGPLHAGMCYCSNSDNRCIRTSHLPACMAWRRLNACNNDALIHLCSVMRYVTLHAHPATHTEKKHQYMHQ